MRFWFVILFLLSAIPAYAVTNQTLDDKTLMSVPSGGDRIYLLRGTTGDYKANLSDVFTKLGATQLTGLTDVGSSTVGAGRLLINDGTKFQSVSLSGSCSLTSAGVISCSVGGGSGGATQLTGLSDVGSSTAGAGRLLINDGTRFQSLPMIGQCTINSSGTIDCGQKITGAQQLTGLSDVGSATVTAGNLLIADGTRFQSVAFNNGCGTVSAAGSLTSCYTKDLALAATGATNINWNVPINTTVNRFLCWTKSGTGTVDLRQCGSPHSGCSSVLSSALSVTTTPTEKSIIAAANSITGKNFLEYNITAINSNWIECGTQLAR